MLHIDGPFVAAAILAFWALAAAEAGSISVWPVDPHVRVFRDTERPAASPDALRLRAARNEYEPGQFAIRSAQPLKDVRVELSPLEGPEGHRIGPEQLSWSFVGFIPLTKNTPLAEHLRVRAAPCEVPDPLLDARGLDLPADTTQPVWLTIRVPRDAAPGVYKGQVTVAAGATQASIPVELAVRPFALPDERHLFVTNWFSTGNIAKAHKVAPRSEPFWALLERYARNMAEHRQNVFEAPWALVEVTRDADGKLSFDYQQFDRFVELFLKAGVADRIEITHVGSFGEGGWSGSEIVLSRVAARDRGAPGAGDGSGKTVRLSPEEGLRPLLADIERHLAERGWLDKAMIHVADEPSLNNVESWRRASDFVHQAAPRLRRIDAIETLDFTGALEVWVMKLSHFDRWRQAYEARRAGNEFWFYLCCHPYGSTYPNRFLDYPLAAIRVLHWINFTEDLPGYLHWGLNHWRDEPFGAPPDNLPPGDTHVVYPGTNGPLNSIRWEIQRESLEDYEYLRLLAARTAELKRRLGAAAAFLHPDRRARELARGVVPAITDWERDPARILAVREAVADEIVALETEPLLLVETEPPAGSRLVQGPIAVEVRGVTTPGAAVKVAGRPVQVSPDGSFAAISHSAKPELTIEAEHNGKTKTVTRSFSVQP